MQIIKQNLTPKISRVAGILILLSLLVPTLNWMLIISKFSSHDSSILLSVLNNELVFRFNIVNGIFTTIIILALAFCLYVILRATNRKLALAAFSLKMVEAGLTATLTLGYFIALLVLKGEPQNIALQKVINLLIENYIFFTAIPGMFFGLSMLVYSYLFLKSTYVPISLAFFGIVSYSLVTIYDSLTVLLPDYSIILPIQIIGSAPVCLFQITIGLWLLYKGIKINASIGATQSLPINN
jgi:Domain of unknown function (DUF4386)